MAMLEAYALSDTGCVRPNNEDCHLVAPDVGLYLVADGMGGAAAGEKASRMAVDTVAECIRGAAERDAQALLLAVEEANRRVGGAARGDPALDGMGTTLVAALETGEDVAIASVGDSRAYVCDEDGLRAITQDQTWVNEVGRPLGIDEASLRTHPMRHVLTMAIGASSSLTINYYVVRLSRAALLLLSSDGLHGVVDAGKIEGVLHDCRNGEGLEAGCRRLIAAARDAGGPDNITVLLARRTG
jgi:protein phosphatase